MKKIWRAGYWAVCLFYFYLLLHTVFVARDARRSVNIVPFDMIAQEGFTLAVWGNIVMFVPLGLYVADWLVRFYFGRALAIVVGASLGIELLQYVFKRGASDIDDVLLNTAGGLIGLGLYALLKWLLKTKERVHQAVAALSLVVGLPVFVLVVLVALAN